MPSHRGTMSEMQTRLLYHGKHMFHKDMTLSTFPLASNWAFKLWNFHHASIPHFQPPSLSPNYMSLTSPDLQRVKKNWHIKPCCVLVWPMGPLNEARIQCGDLSCECLDALKKHKSLQTQGGLECGDFQCSWICDTLWFDLLTPFPPSLKCNRCVICLFKKLK